MYKASIITVLLVLTAMTYHADCTHDKRATEVHQRKPFAAETTQYAREMEDLKLESARLAADIRALSFIYTCMRLVVAILCITAFALVGFSFITRYPVATQRPHVTLTAHPTRAVSQLQTEGNASITRIDVSDVPSENPKQTIETQSVLVGIEKVKVIGEMIVSVAEEITETNFEEPRKGEDKEIIGVEILGEHMGENPANNLQIIVFEENNNSDIIEVQKEQQIIDISQMTPEIIEMLLPVMEKKEIYDEISTEQEELEYFGTTCDENVLKMYEVTSQPLEFHVIPTRSNHENWEAQNNEFRSDPIRLDTGIPPQEHVPAMEFQINSDTEPQQEVPTESEFPTNHQAYGLDPYDEYTELIIMLKKDVPPPTHPPPGIPNYFEIAPGFGFDCDNLPDDYLEQIMEFLQRQERELYPSGIPVPPAPSPIISHVEFRPPKEFLSPKEFPTTETQTNTSPIAQSDPLPIEIGCVTENPTTPPMEFQPPTEIQSNFSPADYAPPAPLPAKPLPPEESDPPIEIDCVTENPSTPPHPTELVPPTEILSNSPPIEIPSPEIVTLPTIDLSLPSIVFEYEEEISIKTPIEILDSKTIGREEGPTKQDGPPEFPKEFKYNPVEYHFYPDDEVVDEVSPEIYARSKFTQFARNHNYNLMDNYELGLYLDKLIDLLGQ